MALTIGLTLASLYIVYIAPVLFAEVLVDGALSYVLFRRVPSSERPLWLTSVVRRTLAPFGATAVLLFAVGMGLAASAPGAKSIGQVIERGNSTAAVR